jgi:hypothetical protein
MEIHPLVQIEWHEAHCLSRHSLMWIEEHADPGTGERTVDDVGCPCDQMMTTLTPWTGAASFIVKELIP